MIKKLMGMNLKTINRRRFWDIIRNTLVDNFFFLPVYGYHFGFDTALKLSPLRKNRILWLEECLLFLEKEFSQFLNGKKAMSGNHVADISNTMDGAFPVWVCWLQGEKRMPDIVRICIKSLKKNIPGYANVILITDKNLSDYIDFPDHIVEKHNQGKISITHFSDFIRFALLRMYGGLWIDATVFVSSPIPDCYFQSDLYSIQYDNIEENIFYRGLTSFLLSGKKGHFLFSFCIEFFYEYWKKYDRLIDVHLINICYAIAYRNFPELRNEIRQIGANNTKVQDLCKILNSEFDEKIWLEIKENQCFHKLNWRNFYSKKPKKEGVETFYGHINCI